MELIDFHGSPGVLVPQDSPYMQAASRAIEHAFGCQPLFTREGGSIPIVTTFHEALEADVLLLGWGQDDDNTHSPNEKFTLADFHRGTRASARLWAEIAGVSK
jgi:succinyl-diaminopimelate desuccinylase